MVASFRNDSISELMVVNTLYLVSISAVEVSSLTSVKSLALHLIPSNHLFLNNLSQVYSPMLF